MSVRAALTTVGLAVAGVVLIGGTAMAATPVASFPGCQGENCSIGNDDAAASGGTPACRGTSRCFDQQGQDPRGRVAQDSPSDG